MGRKKTTVEEKLAAIPLDLEKVEEIAALGAIDTQIGKILGVTEQTINNWKDDERFLLALKKGKDKADSKVIESLYKRATGYDHGDIYFSSYQGLVTETPYVKHFIPDVTAQIFWLKNRQPEQWRDKVEVGGPNGKSLFDGLIVEIIAGQKEAQA